jgi:diguanylate cyclase (GGDEF)-like protein
MQEPECPLSDVRSGTLMLLDMPTISAVSISVTAMLGLVLVFFWSRTPASALTGWWGLAQLIMSGGILIAVVAARRNDNDLHAVGQAFMILATALMWLGVRQFEGRKTYPVWLIVWPAAFLIAQGLGYLGSFDIRLILACSFLALLSFAPAIELSWDARESLVSRWPTVFLLVITGAGYLIWLPLTLTMPIGQANQVFASHWFPAVILIALLGRIALAFAVLAMQKEREELKQRIDALTDPLTGLPNRRALFEAAETLGQHSKYLKGDPVSVLVFDLDHFKRINDTYGHRLGDRVLQLFARTLSDKLESGSILGRLGGEEFAAILPGADLETAAHTAEAVRANFASATEVIDDVPVACTVSVGAACHDDIDCDLNTLFHMADGALYAAKNAGRNRVELLGPHGIVPSLDASVLARSAFPKSQADDRSDAPRNTRRYRGSGGRSGATPRSRRGRPLLS